MDIKNVKRWKDSKKYVSAGSDEESKYWKSQQIKETERYKRDEVDFTALAENEKNGKT